LSLNLWEEKRVITRASGCPPILAEDKTRAWLKAICPIGSHVRLGSCEYEVLGYAGERILLWVIAPFESRLWIPLGKFLKGAELL
jgi:hypothetical protein